MADPRCKTCDRQPKRMNSAVAECSHVDCPHRRTCWSERPAPAYRSPWRAVDPVERINQRKG